MSIDSRKSVVRCEPGEVPHDRSYPAPNDERVPVYEDQREIIARQDAGEPPPTRRKKLDEISVDNLMRDLDRQGAPKISLDEHRQPATPGTIAAIKAARSLLMRAQYDKITRLFPDTGENRRELYTRHLEVFRLGATTSERLFMAANRVGKSVLGAYEVTCHLTGWYPHWWEGKQFNGPTRVWCAGDTSQTVRDIVQKALLGPATSPGVGLIPKKYLRGQPRKKPGMPDAIETAWVKHSSGLDSQVTFKSYEQGRKSFQGTEIEFVWLDEEPPSDVYDECLTRTMTTDGLVLTTATPLSGVTPFIKSFLPDGKLPR